MKKPDPKVQRLMSAISDYMADSNNLGGVTLRSITADLMTGPVQAREALAEIGALKAQNADLLAALTESLAYVEATLSNHDAGCQRHPSTEHARDCILSDLDQIKTAIAKARGDL